MGSKAKKQQSRSESGELLVFGGPVPLPDMIGAYFELRLDDHIPPLKPEDFDLPAEWPRFMLIDYFRTSGEAVSKMKFVVLDWQEKATALAELAGKKPNKKARAYLEAAWGAVLAAGELLERFTETRKPAVHLEASWERGPLTIRRSNPRLREEGWVPPRRGRKS